mmetsp:Transcript_19312/g.41741  ORF Transcript_19312/g.41741 Transcript_19312/m.41741 type:complete len:303 (+) Transcript_19312:1754-2662(+)
MAPSAGAPGGMHAPPLDARSSSVSPPGRSAGSSTALTPRPRHDTAPSRPLPACLSLCTPLCFRALGVVPIATASVARCSCAEWRALLPLEPRTLPPVGCWVEASMLGTVLLAPDTWVSAESTSASTSAWQSTMVWFSSMQLPHCCCRGAVPCVLPRPVTPIDRQHSAAASTPAAPSVPPFRDAGGGEVVAWRTGLLRLRPPAPQDAMEGSGAASRLPAPPPCCTWAVVGWQAAGARHDTATCAPFTASTPAPIKAPPGAASFGPGLLPAVACPPLLLPGTAITAIPASRPPPDRLPAASFPA